MPKQTMTYSGWMPLVMLAIQVAVVMAVLKFLLARFGGPASKYSVYF